MPSSPCSRILTLIFFALMLMSQRCAAQQTNYILRSPSYAQAEAACQTYGLTMVSTIKSPDTYLVSASSSLQLSTLQSWVQGDPNVQAIELDRKLKQNKMSGATPVSPTVPSTVVVTDKTLVGLYGAQTWAAYVQQTSYYSTNIYSAGISSGATGHGIIGVIDTGIDATNPVLAAVVIPGYDFTRNTAGYADDSSDLDQSTAHILHQSTAHILHGYTMWQLDALSSAVLDADTASALAGVALPDDYGHGTMVAGLIHLVAPSASLMALKAFQADGTANQSDIVRAIYYAADNGVNVLNMSFGVPELSDSMMKAINYATRKGVVCLASVGNDGQTTLMYPAAYGNVVGVASVNSSNQASTFTNTGPDMVALAAPGEGLITTYPGNHYAIVSGTSFSVALVSGAADVLLSQVAKKGSAFQPADIARALKQANPCVTDDSLGAGCFDMSRAMAYIQRTFVPPPSVTSTK